MVKNTRPITQAAPAPAANVGYLSPVTNKLAIDQSLISQVKTLVSTTSMSEYNFRVYFDERLNIYLDH